MCFGDGNLAFFHTASCLVFSPLLPFLRSAQRQRGHPNLVSPAHRSGDRNGKHRSTRAESAAPDACRYQEFLPGVFGSNDTLSPETFCYLSLLTRLGFGQIPALIFLPIFELRSIPHQRDSHASTPDALTAASPATSARPPEPATTRLNSDCFDWTHWSS